MNPYIVIKCSYLNGFGEPKGRAYFYKYAESDPAKVPATVRTAAGNKLIVLNNNPAPSEYEAIEDRLVFAFPLVEDET